MTSLPESPVNAGYGPECAEVVCGKGGAGYQIAKKRQKGRLNYLMQKGSSGHAGVCRGWQSDAEAATSCRRNKSVPVYPPMNPICMPSEAFDRDRFTISGFQEKASGDVFQHSSTRFILCAGISMTPYDHLTTINQAYTITSGCCPRYRAASGSTLSSIPVCRHGVRKALSPVHHILNMLLCASLVHHGLTGCRRQSRLYSCALLGNLGI